MLDFIEAVNKVQHPLYRELLEAAIRKHEANSLPFPSKGKINEFVEAANHKLKTGIDYKSHLQLVQDKGLLFLTSDSKYFKREFTSKAPTLKEQKQLSLEISKEFALVFIFIFNIS